MIIKYTNRNSHRGFIFYFWKNQSKTKAKLSRAAHTVYSAFEREFGLFFCLENALSPSVSTGAKSQRAKGSETREVYSRWSDRVVENAASFEAGYSERNITLCALVYTREFAMDSFRALAQLLHIKIKRSAFKINLQFLRGLQNPIAVF